VAILGGVGTGRVVVVPAKYPTSRKGREKWGTRRGDVCGLL